MAESVMRAASLFGAVGEALCLLALVWVWFIIPAVLAGALVRGLIVRAWRSE